MTKVKVLVVDDSRSHREQIERSLHSAGYSVVLAEDGVMGLEVLQNDPGLGLVLCDVNMPRMSGLLMLQRFCESHGALKIPVIMVTTEADPTLKLQGKEVGVRAWVTKPVNMDRLLAAVKKLTGGGEW